jgi:predicted nucleic acid-binding protein
LLILDTNVLSALMRAAPDPALVGRRQKALQAAFEALLMEDLQGRVFDFDISAAAQAAALAARRQRAGRPVDMRDTQIAGIALARQARVATRNTRHYDDLAVGVIDPWAVLD